jgi:hypothetical protein
MADFANEKSEMARDFANRIETYPLPYFLNIKLRNALLLKTLSENYVFVFEYYYLKYLSFNSYPIVEKREKKGFKKGTEFHVSEAGGGSLPCFLLVKNDKNNFTKTLDRTYKNLINYGKKYLFSSNLKLFFISIKQLRESSIYDD